MSSSTAVDPSQIISDFSKDVIINYISISYVALLAYDSSELYILYVPGIPLSLFQYC